MLKCTCVLFSNQSVDQRGSSSLITGSQSSDMIQLFLKSRSSDKIVGIETRNNKAPTMVCELLSGRKSKSKKKQFVFVFSHMGQRLYNNTVKGCVT